jgi:hypothetical protein
MRATVWATVWATMWALAATHAPARAAPPAAGAVVTLVAPASVAPGWVTLQQVARVDHAAAADAGGMSPPGRPKGEFLRPEAEGSPLGAVPVAWLDRDAPDRQLQRLEVQRIVARALGAAAAGIQWRGPASIALRVHRAAAAADAAVVRRMQPVTLVHAVGAVQIEVPATALADGRASAVMGARLPGGRIVRARVAGPGRLVLSQ